MNALRPLILLLAAITAAAPARALQGDAAVAAIEVALADWKVDEAARIAAAMVAETPEDPRAQMASARVAFYQADYPRARDLAQKAQKAAAEGTDEARDAAGLIAWLTETESTWGAYKEQRRGMFIVRATERDAILVPYAFEALEGAGKAMKEEFGFEPKSPVVVEFYPTRRAFIAASTLTREEVETSGTLAICHFNRIMMLSPAVLARGYDWMDALCHEYIHYTVYSLGGATIPVWLHEGIAKHLETRWRVQEPEPLDPRTASILAEGLQTNRWVTYQQMHPSMAKLPSGELTSLAFAEVAVTAQMLRREHGRDALAKLVAAVRDANGDMDAALKGLWGMDLDGLEKQARRHAAALGLQRVPGMAVFDQAGGDEKPAWLRFADEGEKADTKDADARQLEDRKSQDFVLLGDRLKGRQMYEAAVIEYDKALQRLGHAEPLVVNKKAHALLLWGRSKPAIAALQESLKYAPAFAPTLDNLAEANLRLASAEKDPAKADAFRRTALDYARQSERINPFSIDTHARLAALLDGFSRPEEAAASRERIALLRQGR